MSKLKEFALRKPKLTSVLLWGLSAIITIGCFMYQDKTGPTYPLEGEFDTASGTVNFQFLRSETIGTDLKIMLLDPVPEGVSGYVKYRRYKSNDDWAEMPMAAGKFEFTRRGSTETVEGFGAELPSLPERAGKYEFFVYIDDVRGGEAEGVGLARGLDHDQVGGRRHAWEGRVVTGCDG